MVNSVQITNSTGTRSHSDTEAPVYTQIHRHRFAPNRKMAQVDEELKPHRGDDFHQEHASITLSYTTKIKPYLEKWNGYTREFGYKSLVEMLSLEETSDSESDVGFDEEISEEVYDKIQQILAKITEITNQYIGYMRNDRPDNWANKHIELACKHLETCLDTVEAICEAVVNEDVAETALMVITHITDRSMKLSIAIGNSPGFIGCLYIILKYAGFEFASFEDVCVSKIVNSILNCVHNLSLYDELIPLLREHKFSKVLRVFLSSRISRIRLISLMALAGILTENESLDLEEFHSILDDLIINVRQAAESPVGRSKTLWHTVELTAGIRRLARIDSNKRILVKKGCLPILQGLAMSKKVQEQMEALKAISSLAFDKTNQDVMISQLGLIDLIYKQSQTEPKELADICNMILWTMREKLQKSKFTEKFEKRTANQSQGHIMISYQWENQDILLKLRDKMKKLGKKIWIDVDDMHGSTLDAMAKAVEKSDIVLMCMSLKYKNSDNCRAEAEYVFKKKKKVIPLIMEPGYEPDGYLGVILGSKLYYDFSSNQHFDTESDKVMSAISRIMDGGTVEERDTSRPVPTKKKTAKTKSVASWTQDEVRSWLQRHNLCGARLKQLTGSEIALLLKQEKTSPKQYFKDVYGELGLRTLKDRADFEVAMEELRPSS